MSKDLDKLSSEMRKMKPSKRARQTAMDAAMGAFQKEFSLETEASSEKISGTTQGFEGELRPTGQITRMDRVQTFGRQTMAKFNSLFNFKPQTMMMAGSCTAALIAGLIIVPNMDGFTGDVPVANTEPVEAVAEKNSPEPQSSEVFVELKRADAVFGDEEDKASSPSEVSDKDVSVKADVYTVVVTGQRLAPEEHAKQNPSALSTVTAENLGGQPDQSLAEAADLLSAEPSLLKSEPSAQRGIISVNRLLSDINSNAAKIEAENRQREVEFKQRANAKPSLLGRLQSSVPEGHESVLVESTLPTKIGGLTLEQSAPEFKTVTEHVFVQEASTELVTIPAQYETVTETVVVKEASTELVVTPAEYEWVDGDVEGSVVEYEVTPAEFETVSETVIVQEASTELVTIPPVYETVMETVVVQPEYVATDGVIIPPVTKQVPRRVVKTPASTQERIIPAVTKTETRRVIKTPASTVERVVPYEKKGGKTRVPVKAASVIEKDVPAVTKEVKRRVIKTPAITQERTIPGVTRTVERQVLATPPKFYLRDDDGNIVREFESRDAFEIYKANLPTPVAETPVSTFSVDVDTSSYSFLRASIHRGQLPPRSSIRLEEMINYFPYDYKAPKSADEPFKANVTVTSNPWDADKKLMHIGIKGYVPKQAEKPRSNLVFLIDTSGSMSHPDKLPLLVNSFKLLLNTLDEDDTVSIVAYASASGTVLEPTAVKNKSEILAALNNLRAGGSTAGAAGLELAYQKAQESFDDEGVNRVILATDGDFNVGFSSPEDMKTFIQKKRKTGIFLSVLGFGMGNYNDHLMQSLAQNGNGVAAYIDNLSEANKVLANEAGSALFTIAKDVKIQVEFNPEVVAEYRLIGYETRALKRQDFNNDKVDAGEIGAGHSVTAIYEMTPVGSPAVTMDKLRYVSEDAPKTTGSDEYAFVKIRHKLPDADKSTLQTFPISKRQERSLKSASDNMRFATAVAIVGQKLRGDTAVEDYSYKDAIQLAKGAKGEDENGYRAEFIQMVKLIDNMSE